MPEFKISLIVDGIDIPLNPFVTKMVGNLIQAILSSLHGVDEGWKEAILSVERTSSL